MQQPNTISIIDAQQKYFLNHEAFQGLYTVIYIRNSNGVIIPHYPLENVIDLFCQIHKLNDQDHQEINRKLIKLKYNHQKLENIQQRKLKLTYELNKYNLPFRTDSKLCGEYISGKVTNWTLQDIVYRLCQMNYLFTYHDIKTVMKTNNLTIEEAEEEILKKIGNYPTVWPWMIEPENVI